MGEVYRAKDTKLRREVALKVLPDTFTHDPERLARFRREAQVLAALNHPHIAQIHGLEEANGTLFLVLELVDGESLDKRIARGPIPTEEALAIAKQIAEALEAAHDKGIVHRDLKPANIALTSDGQVKVLDFGLAKAVEASEASLDAMNSPTITSPAMMTQGGVILGTAAYMAPEQAKGKAADKRSDVWAFGCVLYEMLTGKRAFDGDDVGETLAAVIRGELNRSAWPRDLPPLIVTLVRRALEKDRSRRIADFSTVSFLLSEASTPSQASQQAAPATTTRARWRARVAGLVAVTALIVAISTIMGMRYLRPAPDSFVTRFGVVTAPTADPFSFALSADGRQVAFVAIDDGTSRLWVRPFDSENARPLAGTEGASNPFWKPDGRAIGFFAQGKLKVVEAAGGLPQALTNVPGARGGTWNQDGVIVFAPPSGLMRIAATGGPPVVVTHPASDQHHRWPQFLPDGRRFLFLSVQGPSSTHGVYLGSLDGREPIRLLAGETAAVYAPPGFLLHVIDGVLVAHQFNPDSGVVSSESVPLAQPVGTDDGTYHSAFSVSPTALAHRAGGPVRRQLVWLDRAGHVTGTVGSPDDASLASPELAPGGRRVAVSRYVQGNFDIYINEIGGRQSRFTFDPTNDRGAIWSPDASHIVFSTARNGKFDLFEKVASGASDEQPLLVTPQDKMPCDWTRDGRFLLYASLDPTTGSDLWALPRIGDGKPFPVVKTNADEREGQFSPDSRWVAYVSNEGGNDEVYIQPFPGPGAKKQASTNGGIDPRWGRDGRELFYVAPDGKLMAVAIHVEPDGRALNPGPPTALFTTRVPTGANITLGFITTPQYAVGPDGRFLMNVTTDDNSPSPISIVLNWATALKK